MNKQTVRIIQFTIISILIFVSFVGGILGILLLIPLVLAILFGFLMKSWYFFWNILFTDIILLAISFTLETLNFKIADIFGKAGNLDRNFGESPRNLSSFIFQAI